MDASKLLKMAGSLPLLQDARGDLCREGGAFLEAEHRAACPQVALKLYKAPASELFGMGAESSTESCQDKVFTQM